MLNLFQHPINKGDVFIGNSKLILPMLQNAR
jgi:hypothetical protein